MPSVVEHGDETTSAGVVAGLSGMSIILEGNRPSMGASICTRAEQPKRRGSFPRSGIEVKGNSLPCRLICDPWNAAAEKGPRGLTED